MGNKLSKEEFIKRAKDVHGDKYDYSKVNYENYSTKVCIICPEHGEFWQVPNSHLSGNGCPACAGLRPLTTQDFIKRAVSIHGNKYDYSNAQYISERKKIKIICPIHGEFFQTPKNHLRGNGCPECGKKYAREWRKNDYKSFIEESTKRFNNSFIFPNIETEYENSHSKIHIKCKKCGTTFEKIACDHLTSPHGGCPKCYGNKSKGEEEIANYIISLIGNDKVCLHARSVIPSSELDIYIPSLNIAFEYNGLYWHSDAIKEDKNYHLQKTEACESRGIKLIQIFEDEYINHKEIVLKKIEHILGYSNAGKIMARKCSVKEIEWTIAKRFLDIYHIQGSAKSTIYLGIYFNDSLVGVMTFIKRKNCWELNRFATNYNYICSGLGSKLFSYFVRNYNPDEVKSFADRRWTSIITENFYEKIGFKQETILLPDYRYIISKRGKFERAHKFGFRKKLLKKKYDVDTNNSETDIMKKLGIHKIYDCGLIKYVWKKNMYI